MSRLTPRRARLATSIALAAAALGAGFAPTPATAATGAAWCADHCSSLVVDRSAGRAVGKVSAERVLARHARDGHDAKLSYQPRSESGRYRFTPGFDFAAAPSALASTAYARDCNEVRETGSARADARRSADQTAHAHFWYEFSDIGWNRIARAVAREHKQDLWQSARTFALLNAAMADAYIAGWDAKYHHDFWRPVTAIRAGAADGNGAAAAVVLAHAFGRDEIRFAFASSSALPGHPVREFKSFSAAAEENADSRVRAGIHFRAATVAGLKLGRQIGGYAIDTMLRPLPAAQAQGDVTTCRTVC